ncbi:STAS domain-containing protein [Streptomyces sp. NPDC099050]|uniref:STAS domain-containing protein n=1 Tax=Streptomyces sp. NPDC099050 TaxID=3366100 RepID=UPI0037FD0F3F
MITTSLQYHGTSVLLGIAGTLGEDAGAALQRALDSVENSDRVLMIDMHQVPVMDADGLLHVLDLHRRAECLGLRTLIVGWQPQPQQLMATVAGTPGAGAGERYAVAGFRRLLQDRAQRARDRAELDAGSLPTPNA